MGRALAVHREAARFADADRLAAQAQEVVALGRRLYHHPVGPLCLYPHAAPPDDGAARRVSHSGDPGDPDDPARIVVRLEAVTLGCAWLLDRWDDLRAVLECGQSWQPHDRLKAVRMLGRQPLEAPDDPRGGRQRPDAAADHRDAQGSPSGGRDAVVGRARLRASRTRRSRCRGV